MLCCITLFAVGLPEVSQLLTNYRTHQGVLDTAALIVDLIKVCVWRQYDMCGTTGGNWGQVLLPSISLTKHPDHVACRDLC